MWVEMRAQALTPPSRHHQPRPACRSLCNSTALLLAGDSSTGSCVKAPGVATSGKVEADEEMEVEVEEGGKSRAADEEGEEVVVGVEEDVEGRGVSPYASAAPPTTDPCREDLRRDSSPHLARAAASAAAAGADKRLVTQAALVAAAAVCPSPQAPPPAPIAASAAGKAPMPCAEDGGKLRWVGAPSAEQAGGTLVVRSAAVSAMMDCDVEEAKQAAAETGTVSGFVAGSLAGAKGAVAATGWAPAGSSIGHSAAGASGGSSSQLMVAPAAAMSAGTLPRVPAQQMLLAETDCLLCRSAAVLARVSAHPHAPPFSAPIDVVRFPDYCTRVPRPMDLRTAAEKLCRGLYEFGSQGDAVEVRAVSIDDWVGLGCVWMTDCV